MPFTVLRKISQDHQQQAASTLTSNLPDAVARHGATSSVRPRFNSNNTAERLHESSQLQPLVSKMGGKIQKGRRPVFTEVGLDIDAANTARSLALQQNHHPEISSSSPMFQKERDFGAISELRSPSTASTKLDTPRSGSLDSNPQPRLRKRQNSAPTQPWYSKLTYSRTRPRVKSAAGAPPEPVSGFQRVALIAMLIAVVIPAINLRSSSSMEAGGAQAGPIMPRETSPTDVCHRWAHQVADINGTLYIYGGEAKTEVNQEEDTWNNYLVTLDLTKDWSNDEPALRGLEVPNGPPAVANGFLWRDYDSLYLYGGQFADNPYEDPAPESIWQYNVRDEEWTEFKDPKTSNGNYSTESDLPVRRAAEGAGISVPELGRSWYFGGHIDWATVPGWSTQTKRVFLKSLLEFTHPGFANSGIEDIETISDAEEKGVFRNITEGGIQKGDFPERADGVLVYVPGWGELGVLIGMAGGRDGDTFTHNLKTLTVYDIATSEWYHQETRGEAPSVRVNPCAVVASPSDASSFQIYMFGGQNLEPYEDQIQNNDLFILSIPSFQWIKADMDSDNAPRGRAGHTCTMRDGQMIVVGGYMGEEADCDDPGFYVFDASNLKWTNKFKAGDHDADFHPDNSVLAGSYGYTVPEAVYKEIGGDEEGGATVTEPVADATGGPFRTGQPPVFTVTPTSDPNSSGSDDDNKDDSSGGDDGVPAGTIAAGVIAGIAGALAFYLGFCAWLYRRQVRAYKRHLAVANRYSGASSADVLGTSTRVYGAGHRARTPDESDETFGWVGSDRETTRWLSEPKWTPDTGPSPGSGASATSPFASQEKRSTERGQTSGSGSGSGSGTGGESSENLLEGQEPNFFNVVLGPRRALRVVNGMD